MDMFETEFEPVDVVDIVWCPGAAVLLDSSGLIAGFEILVHSSTYKNVCF